MKKRKPENIPQEDWDSVESPALTKSILSGMKPVAEIHPICRTAYADLKKHHGKHPFLFALMSPLSKRFGPREEAGNLRSTIYCATGSKNKKRRNRRQGRVEKSTGERVRVQDKYPQSFPIGE